MRAWRRLRSPLADPWLTPVQPGSSRVGERYVQGLRRLPPLFERRNHVCVYGSTKAFVSAFSLSLHKELAASKVRVQAVLPGATATDFWEVAGTSLERLPSRIVMKAEDMGDAALAGLDQGELVTIPSLPDISDWETYEAARQRLMPKLSLSAPALRYGVAVAKPVPAGSREYEAMLNT